MRTTTTVVILIMLTAAIGALSWLCLHLPQPATNATLPQPPAPSTRPAQPAIKDSTPSSSLPPPTNTQPIAVAAPQSLPQPIDPQPAAPPEQDPNKPLPVVWKTVYEQHFDTEDALNDFYQVDGGSLEWFPKYKALYLKNDGGGGQIYAALHRSLPGDLRVRMRVLRAKHAKDINIGLLFNIGGALKTELGYFAEWKMGDCQIKRENVEKTYQNASTPDTKDRWVQVELTKIGGVITMSTEGKQVAAWTDPQPYRSPKHDLFSLYVWDERTLIDDLIIDRNENDTVKVMLDDPAVKSNLIDGIRGDNNPNPDQF